MRKFLFGMALMFTTPIALPLAILWWGFDAWKEYLEIQWAKVLREKNDF